MASVRGISAAQLAHYDDMAEQRGYVGPKGRHWVQGDERYRLVRGERWVRPETETFDEFIVGHLKYVLVPEWGKRQVKLPRDERHIILRWMEDAAEYQKKVFPEDHKPGQLVNAPPSGSAMELLALADDVYRLSLVERIPKKILQRLRDPASFQGARYELALAGSFTRAGFEVKWLKKKQTKHGEFTISIAGEDAVLVEAKSRHRPGTLHESGSATAPSELEADVAGLYAKALKKETDGLHFLICIDVNLPVRPQGRGQMPYWAQGVREILGRVEPTERAPAREFCLALTNFNWHFDADKQVGGGPCLFTFPQWTERVPQEANTYVGILQALNHYGKRPEGPY